MEQNKKPKAMTPAQFNELQRQADVIEQNEKRIKALKENANPKPKTQSDIPDRYAYIFIVIVVILGLIANSF